MKTPNKQLLRATVLTLLLGLSILLPQRAVAVQPSDNEEKTEATTSATTEELRKRIEKVIDEKREQIKGVLEDMLSKKAGYIGEITRVSETALTIKSKNGTTIVPLTDKLLILQKNQPLSVDKIEVGNWAVVLGTRDDELVEAEFIIVSDTTLRPKNQIVLLGTIRSIDRSELVITSRGTTEERTFTIQKTTKFQNSNGEKATATAFEKDLNVLAIGLEGQDGWELQTVRSLAPLQGDK